MNVNKVIGTIVRCKPEHRSSAKKRIAKKELKKHFLQKVCKGYMDKNDYY